MRTSKTLFLCVSAKRNCDTFIRVLKGDFFNVHMKKSQSCIKTRLGVLH